MKVAVTSQGRELSSPVDARFGRAKYFLVVDTETGENVVDLGAEAVITGHVGPKAFATLESGGVQIYTGAAGTVADAVEQFKAGKLKQPNRANVEGHWV